MVDECFGAGVDFETRLVSFLAWVDSRSWRLAAIILT